MKITLTQTEKESIYRALNLRSIKKSVKNGENPIMFLYQIEEGIDFMDKYNSYGYNDYIQGEAQKVTDRLIRLHEKVMVTFW